MLKNGAVASRKRVGFGLDSRPLTGGGEKRAGEGEAALAGESIPSPRMSVAPLAEIFSLSSE